jgi:hypothetical protein
VQGAAARYVKAASQFLEEVRHLRVRHRLAGLVGQQVLFRDVGDIGRLRVLGQQVIKRLVAARADIFGNRGQPLLGIRKYLRCFTTCPMANLAFRIGGWMIADRSTWFSRSMVQVLLRTGQQATHSTSEFTVSLQEHKNT